MALLQCILSLPAQHVQARQEAAHLDARYAFKVFRFALHRPVTWVKPDDR